MQILHAPTEIAGQMGILCEGLRERGHYASGYNWFNSYLKYNGPIINTDAYELSRFINTLDKHADIIHFYNGNTFLLGNADLPYLFQKGKKMIMHHWGNDVRSQAKIRAHNPYAIPSSYYSDDVIHKNLSFISQYISTAIVQDYEVYQYVKDYYKKIHILPLACKVKDIAVEYPKPNNKPIKIIHAPTNRNFKGSVYVDAAIIKLRKNAVNFVYQAIENMSHREAMQAYKEADIIIDQVLCGSYGMLSVEAMAMGKVVVAFIRDDVKQHFPPDLPIVITKPEAVYEALINLINNPDKLPQIGHASREYAMKFHEIGSVVDKLLDIYSQL
ncbi:glycosyltransferase family protein [Alkaliphilus transvaalensis]|uniref:glycosyltransferase family protein n=1 Tax=Alkaliphilus transvaalensis TaxID=114628 RepID=UPI00047B08F3|nr:glycosyltransferase [Alkaliphilus transvaalensis]